jgi:S1-C subfamily serine protease
MRSIVLLLLLWPTTLWGQNQIPEAVLEAAANVVRVRVPLADGSSDVGTGVYLGDRYVATCYHTFRGNPRVGDVTFQDGTVIRFTLNAGQDEIDQAIIQLYYPHNSLPGVTISEAAPDKGDLVYSVGMGNAIDNRVRIFGGPVVKFFGPGKPPVRSVFLSHTQAATPGDSGGPTFNEHGQLYGCLKGYVNGEDVTLSSRPPVFREFVSPLIEPIKQWQAAKRQLR